MEYTKTQIIQIRKEIRGFRIIKKLEKACDEGRIAKRATIYLALSPETYNADSLKHRMVLETAVKLINEDGGSLMLEEVPEMADQ